MIAYNIIIYPDVVTTWLIFPNGDITIGYFKMVCLIYRPDNLSKMTTVFFVRRVLQCNYNELAICPDFDDFIDSISGGDASLYTLIWEAIGYLLSNDTNAKVFFLFYDVKDSGKSLLGRAIEDLIGKQWVSNYKPFRFRQAF